MGSPASDDSGANAWDCSDEDELEPLTTAMWDRLDGPWASVDNDPLDDIVWPSPPVPKRPRQTDAADDTKPDAANDTKPDAADDTKPDTAKPNAAVRDAKRIQQPATPQGARCV